MEDFRGYRSKGQDVQGDAHKQPVQMSKQLRDLISVLPIKGYTQEDIALIALGMAVSQDASNDYIRGYQDGIDAILLDAESSINWLSRLLDRQSREVS